MRYTFDAPGQSDEPEPAPDRRKEIRVPMDAPVWLRILGEPSPVIEGRIANVSKRGMKLLLPQALSPGVTLQLRIGGKIIMAEVRCPAQGNFISESKFRTCSRSRATRLLLRSIFLRTEAHPDLPLRHRRGLTTIAASLE